MRACIFVTFTLFNKRSVFQNYHEQLTEERRKNKSFINSDNSHTIFSPLSTNRKSVMWFGVYRATCELNSNTITCNYFDKRTKVVEIEIKWFLLSCRFIGTTTTVATAATSAIAATVATAHNFKLKYAHLAKFHVVIANDDEEKLPRVRNYKARRFGYVRMN